jgi:hypothetical protein
VSRAILHVVLALAVLAAPLAGEAGAGTTTSRIGYLSFYEPRSRDDVFRQALRDLGWLEGQNLVIGSRFAERDLSRGPHNRQRCSRRSRRWARTATSACRLKPSRRAQRGVLSRTVGQSCPLARTCSAWNISGPRVGSCMSAPSAALMFCARDPDGLMKNCEFASRPVSACHSSMLV